MNKSFIWIVGVLLLLSFVSAELQTIGTKGSVNPFGNKKIILESITDEKINKDSFMLSEKSLDLPVVRISKTFLWVETDKIAEYKIIRNDVSIVNAETYGKAVLYQDGKLFDDAEFKDLKGQLKEIVSFQYYIKQNISYIVQEPATYKTQCVKTNSTNLTKGSLLETCYEVVDTYKDVTKYKEEWVEYNYETLKSGEYEWLLKGQRKANTKVDFIPKAQGLSLDEYVWWNEDWQYKRQINLTASVGNFSYIATINYSDNMQSDFDDLRFIDCALETTEYNYTRQAFVNATNSTWRIDTNGQSCVMMYYGNDAVNTTSSPSNTYLNPVSYYTLDENTGTTAYDLLSSNDGTNNGATINQVGKIGTAYDFEKSESDYAYSNSNVGITGNSSWTMNAWIKVEEQTNDFGTIYSIGNPSNNNILGVFISYSTYPNNLGINNWGGSFQNEHFDSGTTLIGNWNMITTTYDGTNLRVYVNGINKYNTTGTLDLTEQKLYIGRASTYTQTQYFDGLIDEVMLFSRALTSTEINKIYTQTMPTYTIGEEQSSAGTISIDYVTPPTPENGSNLSTSYIPVEVEVNYTNATLENITFDFYKGGVLNASYFYENETYFVNHSGCTCDNWAFNVTLCYLESIDNTTNCVTTETREVIIDILPPSINITSPLESYYYLSDNQTLDLNFTVEDASDHLDSCWYNYNNTNNTLNCSENTTFNYIANSNTLTLYANDTFGNVNSKVRTWFPDIVILNTTYEEEVLSTKNNTFQVDLWVNTTRLSNVDVNLIHNGTSSLYSKTINGSSYIFTVDKLNAVNTETNVKFYNNITLYYVGSTEVIQLDEANQTITPVYFNLCNGTYTTNALNFSIYREGTTDLINASFEGNLRFWIDGDGSVFQTSGITDNNENQSIFHLCLSPGDEEITTSGIVTYSRTDSDSRDYLFNNIIVNNVSKNIDLFLLATNASNIVTINVVDYNMNYVEGAVLYVQRWLVGSNTFDNVGIITTNTEGDAFINLELYNTYYRFLVYLDGVIVKTTSPEKLASTSLQIKINRNPGSAYLPFNSISRDLTFNNETNVVSFSWVDSSGELNAGCLNIYNSTTSGLRLLSRECSSSVSSTLSYLATSNSTTYVARGILTLDDESNDIISLTFQIGVNPYSETYNGTGYVITILLIGTLIVLGISMGSTTLALVGAGAGLFFVDKFGWLSIPPTILYSLLTLFLIIIVFDGVKKK